MGQVWVHRFRRADVSVRASIVEGETVQADIQILNEDGEVSFGVEGLKRGAQRGPNCAPFWTRVDIRRFTSWLGA